MRIVIDHVSKSFGKVTALSDVSLEIADGELFFLLGPSGCGKTTLLRCLGGFERPTSGRIALGDEDVTGKAAHERNTAMVFQGYALWPHMTVYDNVAFGLEMRQVTGAERSRRVEEALARVQISELRHRRPNELSGGQQQRVALARTLVVQPGCLLLDEPLANLDAKLRRDMRREIRSLCKDSGLTAVYVTHDRQEALSMADRVAVLQDGIVRQVASPQELYRRPASAFIANFIGETNFLRGKVVGRESGRVLLETAGGRLAAESAPEGLAVGTEVMLSLRPEAFVRSAAAGEGVNRMPVTVRETSYLGELADHIAATAQGQEIKFFELNPVGVLRAGEEVTLEIAPRDVVILPDES
ncbi:MAG: ABC transporter ATP-binding protein [Lentisphaeria bacterium]|nr:ABC transporter ATP-binding protein [Lentisphaeria bacterium]